MADIPAIAGSDTGTWKSLVNAVIALINSKFNSRPYVWANDAARLAQTGMTVGEYGYQTDTGVRYRASGATTAVAWESDWITWTTAPTNITVGTGGSVSSLQRYKYIAGRLFFDYKFVLGSSGQSVGTNPNLNLPINILPIAGIPTGDGGSIFDVSVSSTSPSGYTRHVILTTTTVRLYYVTVGSATLTQITSTAPMTWAAGDIIQGGFWADPA